MCAMPMAHGHFNGIPASPRVVFCGAPNKRTARPVQTATSGTSTSSRILEKLKFSKSTAQTASQQRTSNTNNAPASQYVVDMSNVRTAGVGAEKESLYPSGHLSDHETGTCCTFACPPPTPSTAALESVFGVGAVNFNLKLREICTQMPLNSNSNQFLFQFHANRDSAEESHSPNTEHQVSLDFSRDDVDSIFSTTSSGLTTVAVTTTTPTKNAIKASGLPMSKKDVKKAKKEGKNKSSGPRARAPSQDKEEDETQPEPSIDTDCGIPRSPEVIFVYGHDAVPIKVYETHAQPGQAGGVPSPSVVRAFMRWWRARGAAGDRVNRDSATR